MNIEKAEKAVHDFLLAMGQDVEREGLRDTSKRYVKYFSEFLNPEKFKFTIFEGEGYDQMIIQKNITFTSLCEHHLLPFSGVGHIAYIPNEKQIIGISKLARMLEWYSSNLQNQERITQQVAKRLFKELNPLGVAVVLEAEHSCMSIRGIKKLDSKTITSCLLGCFKEELAPRQEFMNLIK